jgi:hypothetical protein
MNDKSNTLSLHGGGLCGAVLFGLSRFLRTESGKEKVTSRGGGAATEAVLMRDESSCAGLSSRIVRTRLSHIIPIDRQDF